MLRRALLAAFLTALTAVSAAAQNVPSTLPKNTFVGRLGVSPGPPQVIPFESLWAVAPFQPVGSTIQVRCHGIDDTDALNTARIAASAANSTIQLPVGTCIVGLDSALTFTSGTVTIQGYGAASVLKAKDSARLSSIIATSSANRLTLRNFVVDGNRAGHGMRVSANSSAILTASSLTSLSGMEVKNAALVGFSAFAPAIYPSIDSSYFHDIGTNEVISNNGATGVYSGNTINGFKITNSIFEDIHPTVTPIGDSAAVNITVSGAFVSGSYFKNNYNVNGAQVAVSDNSDGTHDISTIVSSNIILQTGRFDSDLTGGIEVNGSNVVVDGNVCLGAAASCYRTEGSGGGSQKVIISNNTAQSWNASALGYAAIDMLGAPAFSLVTGNVLSSGPVGVSVQNLGGGGLISVNNNIFNSVTTPIDVIANVTRAEGNVGYNPVGVTASATVGASPATICAGPSPETHYFVQSATNTATIKLATNLVGTMSSTTIPVVVHLGPRECEVVTWATTAPTYVKSVH